MNSKQRALYDDIVQHMKQVEVYTNKNDYEDLLDFLKCLVNDMEKLK